MFTDLGICFDGIHSYRSFGIGFVTDAVELMIDQFSFNYR